MALIIITEEKKDGMYTLTEERLRALVQEIYDKGYYDGKKDATPVINVPNIDPGWNLNPPYITCCKDNDEHNWWKDANCNISTKKIITADTPVLNTSETVVGVGEQIPIPGLENY